MEAFSQGTRVWVPHDELVWKPAVVEALNTEERAITLRTEDGEEQQVAVKEDDSNLPPLRNPDILVGSDDLTDLSYLHEPAVVHNLQVRFKEQQTIYTYCGIVLVALNPYSSLPIYSNDIIHAYSGRSLGELDPHIFAVAEEAFRCMGRHSKNQSIIVSGESGAGKTVSAKYAMRYFATVGGAEAETQIEKKVLASNPVMESIGNAKTIRNDNSSRFGKYIEILFNKHDHIIGAEMRTYLLEKSRVVFQAKSERNYHIFYQLCASADRPELEALELSEAEDFFYTNQGEEAEIENVDDAADFERTKDALSLLGISDDDQQQIFCILAAILHMGNIEIKQRSRRSDDARIPVEDTHVPVVSRLLGVEANMLTKWITHRKIQTGREVFTKPQTADNALRARDALAKHIYAHVFDWLVSRINESLAHGSKQKDKRFIGVLDIYGFETFKVNSFEQFCINYANEKLQQQFNLHVFKLEQDEYIKEKIQWSFIDFYDNQPCIDLIEDKLGVLSLLDEETKMPKGSDDNWATKMYASLTDRHHFEKPRLSNTSFIVKHYADKVAYEVTGFMEKNKDTIYEEHLIMLRGSTSPFIAELFAAKGEGKASIDIRKATVSSQFKNSLSSLMETLNATEPHYVRCIKPNDAKQPFEINPQRLVQQLRACGVLETIRISAAGYPSRWSYREFLDRYRLLATSAAPLKSAEVKDACRAILQPLIADEDKYQFGQTKLFFRAGQVAYLEKLRSDKMKLCCVRIQACVRRWLASRRYQRIKTAALGVQTYGRGLLARMRAQRLRERAAATKIQATFRAHRQRRQYAVTMAAVVRLQAAYRALKARRALSGLRREAAALKIQSTWRMWAVRRQFLTKRNAAVTIQCAVRQMLARRVFKQLKIEARSVAGMKAKTVGLEKKIFELQQTMDRRIQETHEKQAAEVARLKEQLAAAEAKESTSTQASASEIERLRARNNELEQELESTSKERDALQSKYDEETAAAAAEQQSLKAKLEEMTQTLQMTTEAAKGSEGLAEQLEALNRRNMQLQSELADERAALQLKIKTQAEAEERVKALEHELLRAEMKALHDDDGNDDGVDRGARGEYVEVRPQSPNGRTHTAATGEYMEVGGRVSPSKLNSSVDAGEELDQAASNAIIQQLRSDLAAAEAEVKRLHKQQQQQQPVEVEGQAAGKTATVTATATAAGETKSESEQLEGESETENALAVAAAAAVQREQELTAEMEELKMTLEQLRRENKELMLAGQSPTVAAAAAAAAKTSEGKSAAAQRSSGSGSGSEGEGEAGSGSTSSSKAEENAEAGTAEEQAQGTTTQAEESTESRDGAATAGSDEHHDHVADNAGGNSKEDKEEGEQRDLQAELREASTNIARLQLANRMLNDKVQALEKAKVSAESRLKRLTGGDGELDPQVLQQEVAALQQHVQQLQGERAGLVSRTELEQAQADYEQLLKQFRALQDDYNRFMTDHCMEDLAKAKTDLQQRNHGLEEELKSLRSRVKDYEHDLTAARAEVSDLQAEKKQTNERVLALKQALTRQMPAESGSASSDGALLQEEVRILIDENLAMREQIEVLEERLQAALNGDVSGAAPGSGSGGRDGSAQQPGRGGAGGGVGDGHQQQHQQHQSYGGSGAHGAGSQQLHQRKQMLGMLKFQEKDTQRVVSELVSKLQPADVDGCMPCIPAHLLFMCVLYADYEENASMLQGLLTKAMTAMKNVVQDNAADLGRLAFWLANGYRLLTNMKQFSGEPQFASPDDKDSATLKTFDLQEYRIVLSDLLVQIYHFVVKHIEHQLAGMIVPGMLEHESLPTSNTSMPSRRRGRSKVDCKVEDILRLLTRVHGLLTEHCVEPRLVQQVFRQLFYIINATMCNHLLLRKDLVRLTKGMQVRYNISKLEDWARDHNLEQICSSLVEAVQITQLLQCNKSKPDDIDTIFETCTKLKPLQIQKVLQMYTPEDFEERVPAALIRAAQARVDAEAGGGTKLLLDTSFIHPVTFPFTPSSPRFPTLDIPPTIKLDFVTKI